jgi:hypothetical protein
LSWQAFWFSCFPHVTGRDEKGFSNNWWEYYQNLVYTVSLEILVNDRPVSGNITVDREKSHNFRIMATLSDGRKIDVTDDCTVIIDTNAAKQPNVSVDTENKTITWLTNANSANITVWRDGVRNTLRLRTAAN